MSTRSSITRLLSDYTAPALLIPRLQRSTPPAVMEELSQVLHQADNALPDLRCDSRTAIGQELLTSVTLEFGAVFPQVRVAGLQRPRFALGRAAQPLSWLVSFYPPTELVFLALEPEGSTPESERLAETLTRLGRDHARLNELRLARTAEEMFMLLGQFPIVSAEELATVQAQRLERTSYYPSSSYGRGQTRRR
jgi:mannitol/fructose-specific phosphotransferase system IIA component (Ntr-type)